eukprot:CAMPEP_0176488410 /NCGR_PEP_ID=MMETSP0200_2-20121128/6691_1 /TAXON_ID=947934 /ORGANISM="Chaetoceros sp., Strain GSL56" /LENGTH=635 /DNA_ID=CAMNT_0017885385 /DNA_START=373 /DNA_END=2280 /DNA_ORIENTATION=+
MKRSHQWKNILSILVCLWSIFPVAVALVSPLPRYAHPHTIVRGDNYCINNRHLHKILGTNNWLIQRHRHPYLEQQPLKRLYNPLQSSSVHHDLHSNNGDITSISSSSSSSPNNSTTKTNLTIFTILAATSLNLLGFTLTSPLNPTLGKHFNLPTGASFGSLTSAYPAGMLIGLFTWPRMSDSMGRKRIMAISLLGSGLGLGLQSWAIWKEWSLGMFFVTRVLTGVFSGSAPVAKAFLADIGDQREKEMVMMDEEHRKQRGMVVDYKEEVEEEQQDKVEEQQNTSGRNKGIVAQYLGWRDAASTLSYIVGPALGGILYEVVRCWGASPSKSSFDLSMRWLNQGRPFDGKASYVALASDGRARALAAVIGIAGLGSLMASLMVMVFVKDCRGIKKDEKQDMNDSTSQSSQQIEEETVKKELELISCPLGQSLWSGVATVCVISFLYHIADSTFFAFYPALLQSQMNFDVKAIGMSFTAFACVSFLCSATSLSKKIIEKVGVVKACAFGLSAIGAGLFGLSTSASSFVSESVMKLLTFAAAGLYFAGVPLYGPTIPTMLLLCVPPYQRGAVMGVDGVINTIARILTPLVMGDVYRRCGATVTFGIAGAAVFGSSVIALLRRFLVVREQRKNTTSTSQE